MFDNTNIKAHLRRRYASKQSRFTAGTGGSVKGLYRSLIRQLEEQRDAKRSWGENADREDYEADRLRARLRAMT